MTRIADFLLGAGWALVVVFALYLALPDDKTIEVQCGSEESWLPVEPVPGEFRF